MQASRVPVDEIEQRKQVKPNDVEEVPVEAADFDGSVVFGSEASFPGCEEKPEKNAEPDDHVERVQAGHNEIKSEENLRMTRVRVLAAMPWNFLVKTKRSAGNVMLVKLVFIFDPFDAEKGETEKHGGGKAGDQEDSASSLRRPHGEHNGQTAANEDRGVGCAEGHVDGFAGGSEVCEVPVAVNQIRAKQSPEEHDFGREENPHAQAGGITLLLLIGGVV